MEQSEWKDYYAYLGLSEKGPLASLGEIRKAHRDQVEEWFPDQYESGSERWRKAKEIFPLISEAFNVLSDPERRQEYDREWLRRNTWFAKRLPVTSGSAPQIAVEWDPPNPQESVFYNISRGEKKKATLNIKPRIGQFLSGTGQPLCVVEMQEPEERWLKIVEPEKREDVPPFTAKVEVDTTGLEYGAQYSGTLTFQVVGSSELHREPVRISVAAEPEPPPVVKPHPPRQRRRAIPDTSQELRRRQREDISSPTTSLWRPLLVILLWATIAIGGIFYVVPEYYTLVKSLSTSTVERIEEGLQTPQKLLAVPSTLYSWFVQRAPSIPPVLFSAPPTATPTAQARATVVLTAMPRPTSTPRPTATREVIDSGNAVVSISLHPNPNRVAVGGKGMLTVRFLLYDKPPPEDLELDVIQLTEKDIAGNWIFQKVSTLRPDGWGLYSDYLIPGHYVLQRGKNWDGHIRGGWYTGSNPPGVAFPIEKGRETLVEVFLSRLEVGVVGNGEALRDWPVKILDENYDVAGIPMLAGEDVVITDWKGLVTFYMGPGKYRIGPALKEQEPYEYKFSVVTVSPIETKREIIKFP